MKQSSDTMIDTLYSKLTSYLKENAVLIYFLSFLAIAVYGFELFNFNITIDEEIYPLYSVPNIQWITQGRWGMYILNSLLPYNVVPFVPIGTALVFHIMGIVLMLESWSVKSRLLQFAIGSIGLSYPVFGFVYTFSTFNYGIGIGIFSISLSLFIYSKVDGINRLFAVLPAAFALSIYQAFLPALACLYIVYFILVGLREEKIALKEIIYIGIVQILSLFVYLLIQELFFVIYKTQLSDYVVGVFNYNQIIKNFSGLTASYFNLMKQLYLGESSVYAIDIKIIGLWLVLIVIGIVIKIVRTRIQLHSKIFLLFLTVLVLTIPTAIMFLTNGYYEMRFLIGLPIALSGLTLLGMEGKPRNFQILTSVVIFLCVYQFTVSVNRLFASSYLMLQSDRLLASRLIDDIDDAKAETETNQTLEYLEMVGYPAIPETNLKPKIPPFGFSFFEWDYGNVYRILAFMNTLGYTELKPMPVEGRIKFAEIATSMPNWPEKGSIQVVDGTVIVKFSPYSYTQKHVICTSLSKEEQIINQEFCQQ